MVFISKLFLVGFMYLCFRQCFKKEKHISIIMLVVYLVYSSYRY